MINAPEAELLLASVFCISALSAAILGLLTWWEGRIVAGQLASLNQAMESLKGAEDNAERAIREETKLGREEFSVQSQRLRQELGQGMTGFAESLQRRVEVLSQAMEARFQGFETLQGQHGQALRNDLSEAHRVAIDTWRQNSESMAATLHTMLDANERRQAELRQTLTDNLTTLRQENETKLEQMRATVDEKLHSTLERRLGESFQIVSERLDKVHQGLGEMQSLATGVGDLKRVLTNVKTRGGWAEVQLGALLENMLSPEQFIRNARIQPSTTETVEFAIRLPGHDGEAGVLLPIDAKFPHEDYERLQRAQERGDAAEVEQAAQALATTIRKEAKRICDKYIAPPASTDFAIMYLPTEGLFAEAIRRNDLLGELQQRYKVTLAGPTTLSAFLSSLQMGFRTLAVQKRSSEVWKVLGEAKAEFQRYGEVWDKLQKQLETAQRTVEEAGRRTKAVSRKLRGVETLTDQSQSAATDVQEWLDDIDDVSREPRSA